MKLWVCPNCFRRSLKSGNMVMSLCSCGEYMEIVSNDEESAETLVNNITKKEVNEI